MDLNDLRILITVISFVIFAGIVYWAYSGHQRARFEEASRLPFADSDLPGESASPAKKNNAGDRP